MLFITAARSNFHPFAARLRCDANAHPLCEKASDDDCDYNIVDDDDDDCVWHYENPRTQPLDHRHRQHLITRRIIVCDRGEPNTMHIMRLGGRARAQPKGVRAGSACTGVLSKS